MNKKGFTMIEIIISLTIIVLISTISFVVFNKDNSKENLKTEEQIVSAANVYTSSNSIIDTDVLKETGRTFITVGELIDNGYLSDDVLKNKDKFGNVIDRTSRVAIYLTDDVNSLYFDFNGIIDSSLVIVKEDKKVTYAKKSTIKVKDVVFNKYLRVYDSNNNDAKDKVSFEIKNSNGQVIYTESNLNDNFDTRYIKEYSIEYSYENISETLKVGIIGKYDVELDVDHTKKTKKSYNPSEQVNLSIVPDKNYVYDSSNFKCIDVNTNSEIKKTVTNNILKINSINTDIKCSGSYKENVKKITLNIANGSVTNVIGGTLTNNIVKAASGSNISITFTPISPNYSNTDIRCNGQKKYLSNNVLTLNNVNSDMTCNVTFSIPTYTLYLNIENGNYNGQSKTNISLKKGSDLELNIFRNNGYIFDYASCSDGITFDSNKDKLTLKNIDSYKYCYIYYLEDNLKNRVKNKAYNYDDPYYIKYGNYTWIVYDFSFNDNYDYLGIKMILDRTAGVTSFSKTACCDTGVCKYENNNFINNYIGNTVLNKFYNTLPSSKSTVLIENNYNTGYRVLDRNWNTTEDHSNDRTATSVIGMLEDDDSYIVQNYKPFYENSLDQMTWTSILGYQGSTVYGRLVVRYTRAVYNSYSWDIYELVNTSRFPNDYYYSSKGHVYPPNKNYYYRPVIVMDVNTKVKSGSGTKFDPFVVE